MYKLAVFLIIFINSAAFSQTVPKSYHPYDPSIDGSFIINGAINAKIEGNYIQNKDSLNLLAGSTAVFDPHWIWDIVHKPSGNGNYSFSLKLGVVEYPLAEFTVDNDNLYVKRLYFGTKIATDMFWSEGSKISHWQIGQYLAAVVPIANSQIPRCSSLIIRVGDGVNLDLITLVTQKPEPCNQTYLCLYTPQEYIRRASSRDFQVLINRFPNVLRISGVNFLRTNLISRRPADIYNTFAASMQLSAFLVSNHSMQNSFYNSSIMMYATNTDNFPDYTVATVLQGYLNSTPMSATNQFFGDLLVKMVNNGKFACR